MKLTIRMICGLCLLYIFCYFIIFVFYDSIFQYIKSSHFQHTFRACSEGFEIVNIEYWLCIPKHKTKFYNILYSISTKHKINVTEKYL